MCSLVMNLFSRDYIKKEIDYIKYRQCFNLLARVQYLHNAWFLDCRTSVLVFCLALNVIFTQDQFAGSEAAGFVLVSLELDGGISESPFDVTVTPSQQSPLSAEGSILLYIICLLMSFYN